ncbi:hypothetical protein ACHAQA_002753 [Verticillium albo-atrum]
MMFDSGNPPFESDYELLTVQNDTKTAQCVPGHPRVRLDDQGKILDFLTLEFCNNDLDSMADSLWWMSKQDSRNISPLHRQAVKRRTVVITEDPKLHLVWIHDRIFVKPLPRYIGSYVFWRDHLRAEDGTDNRGARVRRAALGFLRTYYYLVRYESDFRIAQDKSIALIPDNVTWEQFCDFTASLADIEDQDVSTRYQYGEIRLTRLNFYAPFLLGKSHFQRVDYQYGPYLARFYVPILFIMGVVSVVLSGLQVIFTVGDDSAAARSPRAADVALGFSVAAILMSCGLLVSLGVLIVYKVAMEWKIAIRDRRRLTREREKEKSGRGQASSYP